MLLAVPHYFLYAFVDDHRSIMVGWRLHLFSHGLYKALPPDGSEGSHHTRQDGADLSAY